MMIKTIQIAVVLFLFFTPRLQAADDEVWSEYKAAHFIIFYKKIPVDFVKTVVDAAESSYQDITRNLGFYREDSWMSGNRAKIYIYKDDKDYVQNSKQYQWSHGAALVREKTIRTFPSAHGFFDSTLPHEMGHIIFHEYVGVDVAVPLWFEEGVAMYQEKAKRFGANADVAKALKNGQFIPLTELSNMRLYSDSPPDQVQLFYAESASVVYFMISELGESRFVKLCRELKAGKSFMEALQSAYVRFLSIDDLNKAWINYIQEHQ